MYLSEPERWFSVLFLRFSPEIWAHVLNNVSLDIVRSLNRGNNCCLDDSDGFVVKIIKGPNMLSISPNSLARSSLEEMLDSLRRRDENEKQKDVPPPLPARPRPASRARLPSAKRPLPTSSGIGESEKKAQSSLGCSVQNEDSKGLRRKSFGTKKVKEMGPGESPYIMAASPEMGHKQKSQEISKLANSPPAAVPRFRVSQGVIIWNILLKRFIMGFVVNSKHLLQFIFNCLCSLLLMPSYVPYNVLVLHWMSSVGLDLIISTPFQKLSVWCRLHNGIWESGQIQSTSGEKASVLLSDGSVATVPTQELLPANPDILEGVDDLIQLSYLNEPSVLHNIHYRFAQDIVYSKAGPVLVAVNPFKDVQLYGNDFITAYRQNLLDSPHVYAVADAAYNEMMTGRVEFFKRESGAGKTETAKIAMQYLAAVVGGSRGIESEVLETSCILEAFGNAKTARNDNSSRFGKLTEIHFSATGKMCGAKIQTFLLEKSRVVQLAKGERSYHIFYQLCAGAPSGLRAVSNAACLIGCGIQDLMLALSTHSIQAGREKVARRLTLRQAIDTRDSLAKFIYGSLFDWLVEKINVSLATGKQHTGRSISILDIYGFESFKRNSFEQFCINYANERLQQHFNRHLFKLAQEGQLFKLMQQLERTTPHFIRCIKPNNKQIPGAFEKDLVLEQLRSCGVLEVVRISRSGYPTRMTHQEFTRRYGFLLPENSARQDPLSMSVAILQQFDILPEMYQVGYKKLYFRAGQDLAPEMLPSVVEELQKRVVMAEIALGRKERENAALREQVQQFEARWLEYESKMKSMEEMWQKQMASLQMSLAAARKSLVTDNTISRPGKHHDAQSPRVYDSEDTSLGPQTPDAAAPPIRYLNNGIEAAAGGDKKGGHDPVSPLKKEFEQRKRNFDDEVQAIVEVKSVASLNPTEEVRKLKHRFEVWKRDYKFRLREAKAKAQRMGHAESEKYRRNWNGLRGPQSRFGLC
ncbi:Myosin-2 [Sesamum angolense]|uniref:Myosin-2 n=1 Tax=Sesamum angolense TaxID=2727404 RepID=A0AAE2BUM5_9LAMI|nr:Myosin-2 [Sesamum angolense]